MPPDVTGLARPRHAARELAGELEIGNEFYQDEVADAVDAERGCSSAILRRSAPIRAVSRSKDVPDQSD